VKSQKESRVIFVEGTLRCTASKVLKDKDPVKILRAIMSFIPRKLVRCMNCTEWTLPSLKAHNTCTRNFITHYESYAVPRPRSAHP
jgi:hypothetical protein